MKDDETNQEGKRIRVRTVAGRVERARDWAMKGGEGNTKHKGKKKGEVKEGTVEERKRKRKWIV